MQTNSTNDRGSNQWRDVQSVKRLQLLDTDSQTDSSDRVSTCPAGPASPTDRGTVTTVL